MRRRTNDGGLKVLLVYNRSTSKMERYDEVTPGREREVLRSQYIEKTALKEEVKKRGGKYPPPVLEVSIRIVDPKELEGGV